MKRFFIFLFFLILCRLSIAVDFAWKPVGPNVPVVWYLGCKTDQGNICFALSNDDLQRSTDGGKTWSIATKLDFTSLRDLVVPPYGPDIYVIGIVRGSNQNAFWRSLDFGNTFQRISAVDWNSSIIAVSHNDNATIYVGGTSLLVTHDKGKSWKRLKVPGKYYFDIVIAPDNPKVIYLSGRNFYNHFPIDHVVMRSSDAGKSWELFRKGESACMPKFVTSYLPTVRSYSYGCGIIEELTSKGLRRIASLPSIDQLFVIPGAPQKFIAIRITEKNRSIVMSSDRGKHWTTAPGDLRYIQKGALTLATVINKTMIIGTNGGALYVCKLTNGDCNTASANFSNASSITRLLTHGGQNGALLAVSQPRAGDKPGDAAFLYESADQGKHWTLIPPNPGSIVLNTWFLEAAKLPGHFTEIRYPDMLSTTDGGRTWIKGSLSFNHSDIQLSNDFPGVIYATSYQTVDFYKSVNYGKVFEKITLPHWQGYTFGNIVQDFIDPTSIHLLLFRENADKSLLLTSRDGGKTFKVVPQKIIWSGGWIPLQQRDSFLGISKQKRIFRTIDAGLSWVEVGKVPSNDYQFRIVPADAMGTHLFAWNPFDLYESDDSGRTWVNHDSEINGYLYNDLSDPRYLPVFVATENGVYEQVSE